MIKGFYVIRTDKTKTQWQDSGKRNDKYQLVTGNAVARYSYSYICLTIGNALAKLKWGKTLERQW